MRQRSSADDYGSPSMHSTSVRNPPRRRKSWQPVAVWARLHLVYFLSIAVTFQVFFLSGPFPTKIIDWRGNEEVEVEVGLPSTNFLGKQPTEEKVVVIYTGPTSLNASDGKHWLYLRNFDYFLKHGIECDSPSQDTILVLTRSVAKHYSDRIQKIQKRCEARRRTRLGDERPNVLQGTSLRVVEREDKCYDMEGLYVVFEEVDLSAYDFMVYLNCGIVGPKRRRTDLDHHDHHVPWTQRYTSLLSDSVKMSGLSINCDIYPHIQSMLFAVDQVGLALIQLSGAVYDCGKSNTNMTSKIRQEIIENYEVGMSRAILREGYSIHATHGLYGPTEIRPHEADKHPSWCHDWWNPHSLPTTFTSKWEDFMFFKSSRMFLLPGMEEELHYEHNSSFEIVKLPPKWIKITGDEDWESLWSGGAPKAKMKDPSSLRISVVISHCRGDLSWLPDYLSDLNFKNVTIVSKCGVAPNSTHLPDEAHFMRLPNIGRVDHTMAYYMAEIIPREEHKDNDVVVFLKDNLFKHQEGQRREISELLGVASANGFACLQKPYPGFSQFHLSDVLNRFNMTFYDGEPKFRPDGSREMVNSNRKFKSRFRNFAEWLSSIGIASLSSIGIAPVCYGGSYAVKVSEILDVPLELRKKLEKSLSRGNNIEEGHFVERTWAALFLPTLTVEQAQYILHRAKYVNWFVFSEGGGLLGGLMEWDVFGPPKPLASYKDKNSDWVHHEAQWQWPEKYLARVVDSNNICKRPMVEPDIPEASTGATRAPTAVMCTATTLDDLRYINEWLDFYIVQGFAHFYLYDIDDKPRMEMFLNATRSGWSKYVTVFHWQTGRNQQRLYAEIWTHCFTVQARKAHHTWAANFDVDEFLVLWQHEHVVPLLQEQCQNGSVHIDAYTCAPDGPPEDDTQLQNLWQNLSERLLTAQETYELSVQRSSYGLPRPLLKRNQHCGPLGWDGTEKSLVQWRVKTIARLDDVQGFEQDDHSSSSSPLPKLATSIRTEVHRRTLQGNIMETSWITPDISGSDIASISHYKFKSIPEFIYQQCHPRGHKLSKSYTCNSTREFALAPGAWSFYRDHHIDASAWDFLKARIPWYHHFDEEFPDVSCKNDATSKFLF